jgi:hypothetical protein
MYTKRYRPMYEAAAARSLAKAPVKPIRDD